MNGKSLARRIGIALAAVVGAVVLLVAALVLLLDSNVATKRAVDLVLPSVSKALGREVTLKSAKLHVFPGASVSLAGFAVAGRPGEPPLAELESLDVDVALWPLLRSLGKQIDVRAFTLVRPAVNLVRGRDGTWNYEGLGGAASAGAQPAPAPAPEGGGASVAVRRVRISKAAVRMIDRSAGKDDAGIALKDLDLDASGVGPGLPLEARVAAALAGDRQNLSAQLSIAKLPAGVPRRPEDWPAVQGSVKLAALAIDRIRSLLPGELGAIVRGGTATLDAKVSTGQDRAYRVEGAGDLADLRLRGQPASGRFRALASWTPARPDAARVDLADLALRGPGVDLGGHASVETAPMRATFVITGPLLDLDTVMGLLPEQAPAAKPAEPAGGDLVPEATRRQIQAATARGTIAIDELRGGRLRATNVTARATLARGTLTLDQMDAAVFGGRVSATGTRVSLAEKEPTWNLAAKLSALDLAETLEAFAGRSPLLGKLDGTLQIAGSGTDWARMRDGLAGLAALAVKDGALTTADLGATVLGDVSKALAAAGRGSAAKRVESAAGGRTSFKDFAGQFTVKDGFLAARSPLKVHTGAGDLALGGRIGLDGRLDLTGDAAVPRQALAGAAPGIPLPEKLVVPLGLGGTLQSPAVSVRAGEAVSGLARGEARRAGEKLKGKAQEEGKKKLGDLLKRFGK